MHSGLSGAAAAAEWATGSTIGLLTCLPPPDVGIENAGDGYGCISSLPGTETHRRNATHPTPVYALPAVVHSPLLVCTVAGWLPGAAGELATFLLDAELPASAVSTPQPPSKGPYSDRPLVDAGVNLRFAA
jgi:hypothetical protein